MSSFCVTFYNHADLHVGYCEQCALTLCIGSVTVRLLICSDFYMALADGREPAQWQTTKPN